MRGTGSQANIHQLNA